MFSTNQFQGVFNFNSKVVSVSNLIDIQSQIEKLQKQAGEIKTREFDKTVQEILAKMQAYGISSKDIQAGKVRSAKSRGKAAVKSAGSQRKQKTQSKTVLPAKYRGPNGEGWSGRGLTPRWLNALLVGGKTREDFAIKT